MQGITDGCVRALGTGYSALERRKYLMMKNEQEQRTENLMGVTGAVFVISVSRCPSLQLYLV